MAEFRHCCGSLLPACDFAAVLVFSRDSTAARCGIAARKAIAHTASCNISFLAENFMCCTSMRPLTFQPQESCSSCTVDGSGGNPGTSSSSSAAPSSAAPPSALTAASARPAAGSASAGAAVVASGPGACSVPASVFGAGAASARDASSDAWGATTPASIGTGLCAAGKAFATGRRSKSISRARGVCQQLSACQADDLDQHSADDPQGWGMGR